MICAFISLGGMLLLAAGCAGGPAPDRQRMESALQQLDADSYAATENCLSSVEYDTVEVLDEQHMLFQGTGKDDVWLNQLRQRCPGLREDDTLAFDMQGDRLCSLDTVTVVNHFMFWRRTGPTCALGKFNKLTDAQAGLVRQAM